MRPLDSPPTSSAVYLEVLEARPVQRRVMT